jgi:hypothetical protein
MVCSKLLAKLGKTDDSKQTLKIVGWMIDGTVAVTALLSLGTWLLVSIVFEHLSVKAMAISFAKFSVSATFIIAIISSVVASCYMAYLYFQNKEKFEAIVKAAKLDKLNALIDDLKAKFSEIASSRQRKMEAKIDAEIEADRAAYEKRSLWEDAWKKLSSYLNDQEIFEKTCTAYKQGSIATGKDLKETMDNVYAFALDLKSKKDWSNFWTRIETMIGKELYAKLATMINEGQIKGQDEKDYKIKVITAAEKLKTEASKKPKAENNSACGSHEPEADSTYMPPKTTTPTLQETIKTVTTGREHIASEAAEITTKTAPCGESVPADAPTTEQAETIDEVLNQVPEAQPAISREDVLSAQILEEMIIPEDILDKAKGSFEKELELHPTIAKIIDGRRELAIKMMQSGISRKDTFAELGRQPLPQIGHNATKGRHQIQVRETSHRPVEAIVAQ